jgi:hypothetical protein
MNTTKFSKILLDKSPKKINDTTENILDILFEINEVVRELNSIDFCNPLGYILTKSLPPEGLIDQKLKQYGSKVTDFINKSTKKLELNKNTDTLSNDIEELRISLEDLILPEELKDIIPGGDGLTKLLQDLNDSLVITNTLITQNDKKKLIKSFSNRLIPLSNPINLTEALISSQANNLNEKLRNFIKPERFKSDLLKLIKLINQIDKSVLKIQNIIILMNKIIKSINVLIKITKITIKILKKIPIPAKYVTVGNTVTSSSKVSNFERDINELEKLLNSVSIFLTTSVIKQIKRIRKEILILLFGLNQLYENLKSCSYFEGDLLLEEIQSGIANLNNNINILDDIFPQSIESNISNLIYNGYNINIINEDTTDNNTTLIRRRVIVTNSQNIIEYEGTPTYSNKDQILIKEGQFYIDLKSEINTSDNGTDNINNDEVSLLLNQIGLQYNTLESTTSKEKEINNILLNQINNNPEEKKIYESINGDISNPNQSKVEYIKKIINSLSKITTPLLLQNRLQKMSQSLLQKGYTPEEIQSAIEYKYSTKYNIIIENNNIKITNI